MKPHLPVIRSTGYRLKQVNLDRWFTKPHLPLRFSSNGRPVGKSVTPRKLTDHNSASARDIYTHIEMATLKETIGRLPNLPTL